MRKKEADEHLEIKGGGGGPHICRQIKYHHTSMIFLTFSRFPPVHHVFKKKRMGSVQWGEKWELIVEPIFMLQVQLLRK